MSNVGIWITVAIVLFVLGSIFGLRVSPREKALGLMRDQARKMGLHPRLIVAPEWTKIPMASENAPVWLLIIVCLFQMLA
jgi:uncharacterized membrane protein